MVTQDRWGRACQPGRPGLGGAGENNRPVGRKPSQLDEREDAVGGRQLNLKRGVGTSQA